MSKESVQVVRDWVALWSGPELVASAADPELLGPYLAAIHPDFEGWWARELADGETFEGVEGAARMAMEWLAPWEEYRQEAVEFIDAGEAVIVSYRCRGRGKGSGAEVEMDATHVYTVRDGKIATLWEYMDRDEAFAAAGLER